MNDVMWGGRWECGGCGAAGEQDLWDDEDSPQAEHDCAEDGDVFWYGEWHCDDCGSSSDHSWDDGSETWSNHDCAQAEDDEDDALEEVAA